ncbi:MAG: electron transport complex subunit RsxB [Gammaproteobacteria bacterium]
MPNRPTPEQINAILPQTQCGLCGYNGCMPYATALAERKAAINLCPPGGVNGLREIAKLMNEDPTPFLTEMAQTAKPKMLAVIREAECIGCTKCIQACPVDAILGAGKSMHTVIADECTGCELCIAPCPVDCIDMVMVGEQTATDKSKAAHYRKRYLARNKRLQLNECEREKPRPENKIDDKKAFIQAALLRAKAKKQF